MTPVTLGSPIKGSKPLSPLGGRYMAKWKALVLKTIPDDEAGISPQDLFKALSSQYQVDQATVRDALFLLISSGDLVMSKDLTVHK